MVRVKAIVQQRYGSPEQLELSEVQKPTPKHDEVLVRVHAAALNARDWHLMRGDPFIARLAGLGVSAPKTKIRCSDFAGVVEAVGAGVTRFRPGDEVYGDLREADGALADYLCAPEALTGLKPDRLTFEQAAAAPLAGCTAVAAVCEVADLQAGQRILINGGSGGVG